MQAWGHLAAEGAMVLVTEKPQAAATPGQSVRIGVGRVRRMGRALFNIVAVVAVLAVLGIGVAVQTHHVSFAPVLSGSMQPSIKTGDLAVIWRVPAAMLRVGDVISFYPPGETTTPKLHRIATLTHDAHGITLTTKGDANQGIDPGTATLRGPTAYRLIGVVPLLGWSTARFGHLPVYLLLVFSGVLMGLAALIDLRRKPKVNSRTAAKETTS